MRDYTGYEIVKVSGSIPAAKLQKAVRSGKVSFSADELKGTKPMLLHPMCAKAVKKAQLKGKGIVSMMLSAGEILADMELHGDKSVWAWLTDYKKKKAYNWLWIESA